MRNIEVLCVVVSVGVRDLGFLGETGLDGIVGGERV